MEQPLTRLADALASVEAAHADLPQPTADGFGPALGPLRCAWAAAEGALGRLLHDASAHASDATRRARAKALARFDAVGAQLEQSQRLLAWASDAAPQTPAVARQRATLLAALRRGGADQSRQTQRTVASDRDELRELCGAFAEHHADAAEHGLREAWRAASEPSARAEAWQALHERGREREVLVRDILVLRRSWARTVGYESFAAMQCDGSVLSSPDAIQRWLAEPLAATRVMPMGDTPEHPPRRATAGAVAIARAELQAALLGLLAPWQRADTTLTFDLEPRAEKHPGTWTSAFTDVDGTRRITVCASLPPQLTATHVRSLLHETGHAAELALGAPAALPLCEPDREQMELASLWFERASLHGASLRRLGIDVDASNVGVGVLRQQQYGRPLRLQLALASTDVALHHDFDPAHDGSPLAWARRVLSGVEGRARESADSTVAMHAHLFSHPRGYAGRYIAYPLAEAAADALIAAHGPGIPTREVFARALVEARTPAQWSTLIQPTELVGAIKRANIRPD